MQLVWISFAANALIVLCFGAFFVLSLRLPQNMRSPFTQKLPLLILLLLAFIGDMLAESALRKGVANERWPEALLVAPKKLVEHPAISVLGWSLIAASFAVMVFSRGQHIAGYYFFLGPPDESESPTDLAAASKQSGQLRDALSRKTPSIRTVGNPTPALFQLTPIVRGAPSFISPPQKLSLLLTQELSSRKNCHHVRTVLTQELSFRPKRLALLRAAQWRNLLLQTTVSPYRSCFSNCHSPKILP
jgi:hypothetical protein